MKNENQDIILRYKDVTGNSSLLTGLRALSTCVFGGRQDQALCGILRIIEKARKEYDFMREKCFRTYGTPLLNPDGSKTYTLTNLQDDKRMAVIDILEGYEDLTFSLEIKEPVALKKRGCHEITATIAALIGDIITIEFPNIDEDDSLGKKSEKTNH